VSDGGLPLTCEPATIVAMTVHVVPVEFGYDDVIAA
jgi:hypothetical protein